MGVAGVSAVPTTVGAALRLPVLQVIGVMRDFGAAYTNHT